MGDSNQRLVLGMNVGDGRQTPPGELRTPRQEGEELRTPIPEDVCSSDETKMPSMDQEDVEEELDPRIQEELEHLNQANEEINRVELQLDAQQETQKAALRYERAVSMHNAAREMVFVAEQGVMADKNRLDPTWQEMLNHATCKVNEAEEERMHSEREHQRVTRLCQQAEAKVQSLQKSLKRVIVKSKPYFELKAQFNQILEEHKAKVTGLEQRVSQAKMRYSVALRNLEQISEQIHARRLQRFIQRRASPVGAEAGAGLGAECPPMDTLSMLSLQTIASDLQKFDSVEHLLGLSDATSLNSDELEEQEQRRGGQSQFKHHRSVSL
ncbi:SH3 domain-binding protein 5-like isoform X2 [Gopherus flavomarginatus]|uniref:SH3 domain-binding protein 5-like isoform X2 n=1 Tax=Gopherus flavomarginatus TaxID=286002 RepID=UPI0021CBA8E6|nr:SH3 domain-binding protein 5-like isoform X2 [Gopherus flavomarginatus]